MNNPISSASFGDYSTLHVHFYDVGISALMEKGLSSMIKTNKKIRLLDLGCGDGSVIFSLGKLGLLKNVCEVIGVDLSEQRIRRLLKELPFVTGIVSDASRISGLSDCSVDFVICSQVIEHVNDDNALMLEINRVMKEQRLVYLSSVVKKWYGVYLYYRNGSFRLDSTHLKEYSSLTEFKRLIEKQGFQVIAAQTNQMKFPIIDFVVRLLIKARLLNPNVQFYQRNSIFHKLRKVRIPILGYSSVEVLAKKPVFKP